MRGRRSAWWLHTIVLETTEDTTITADTGTGATHLIKSFNQPVASWYLNNSKNSPLIFPLVSFFVLGLYLVLLISLMYPSDPRTRTIFRNHSWKRADLTVPFHFFFFYLIPKTYWITFLSMLARKTLMAVSRVTRFNHPITIRTNRANFGIIIYPPPSCGSPFPPLLSFLFWLHSLPCSPSLVCW